MNEESKVTSRRDFAAGSVRAFLSIALVEHLCQGNLLAAAFQPTAVKWLNDVNDLSAGLKSHQFPQLDWHKRVEDLFQNQLGLEELLKFIDFDQIQKAAKIRENGALSMKFGYPKVEGVPKELVFGQQIFALGKDRSVVPHGHNNMATAFLILKGNFHGRHYDRVADEKGFMVIKPTLDMNYGPGTASSVTDEKDNVHWFKALDEPAFIFNIHVTGITPNHPKGTGRVYVDPNGEKIEGGLIRGRILESEEAHKLYG